MKRQKASDVFRETESLLSGKTSSFREAFPDVEDIKVDITENGIFGSMHGDPRTPTYTKRTFPGEYVDCSATLCYGGGVNLGQLVRDMLPTRQRELEIRCVCQGYEGSPKGRRKYRPCINSFKVTIGISYVDAE